MASQSPATIFVSFVRKIDKDKLMSAIRKRRNLTSRDLDFLDEVDPYKIYINHSLTQERRKLLAVAKNFKRENSYAFVWVRNGRIFIKKDEQSSAILIRSSRDLKNLKSKNDVDTPAQKT